MTSESIIKPLNRDTVRIYDFAKTNIHDLIREDGTTKDYWYCMVYTDCPELFNDWMVKNFTGKYQADYRFNSGQPAYFLRMHDDEDALLFRLTWV